MTRRREVDEHRRKLGEIRDIMNSMKSLAYMETRKLSRFIDAQRMVVSNIRTVAEDFLSFHSAVLPEPQSGGRAYLLIGSERGFCGDFNEEVVRRLESIGREGRAGQPVLIAVGGKLQGLLQHNERLVAAVEGPAVVEDVEAVLNRIVDTLASHQAANGPGSLYALYHEADTGEVLVDRLLPPFQRGVSAAPGFPHPPILNVPPEDFFGELTDHYLLAALQGMLYSSLMAENHQRLQHLDGAVRHLDEKTADLLRRSNVLRQEEIIEEIEVILLSADTLIQPARPALPFSNNERSQGSRTRPPGDDAERAP